MINLLRSLALLCSALLISACGESGSEPDQYSEVQYRVLQAGGGTFALVSLSAGGFQRRLSPDAVYTTQGPVRFLVEGAPGPHAAEFCRRSGGELTIQFSSDSSNEGLVRLTFDSEAQAGACRTTASVCTQASEGSTCFSDSECATGEVCEKRLVVTYDPTQSGVLEMPLPFADPDVRFEVCAPLTGDTCSVAGKAGDPPNTIYGRFVSGSVGDIASTFLVSDETPAVYFLNSAKDNVSAVVGASDDEPVQLQLLVDNRVVDSDHGRGDVLIRRDL